MSRYCKHGEHPPDGRYEDGRCKTCKAEYRDKVREEKINYYREYRKNNIDKVKILSIKRLPHKNELRRILNAKRKVEVIDHYTNGAMICTECGESRFETLTIDHINGGGRAHVKSLAVSIYRWLIKNNFPTGFRILCYNCNFLACQKPRPKDWETNRCYKHYKHNDKIKHEAMSHYSDGEPECAICNIRDIRVLTIDHINGNGSQHRKELKIVGGVKFYHWLRRNGYPEGYRILCFNCNCGVFGGAGKAFRKYGNSK